MAEISQTLNRVAATSITVIALGRVWAADAGPADHPPMGHRLDHAAGRAGASLMRGEWWYHCPSHAHRGPPLASTAPLESELVSLCHAVQPGHRLRLRITSSAFPLFARNLNTADPIADATRPRVARNSVHHGPTLPSRLELPTASNAL